MSGRTLTGVGGILSCAHRDRDSGKLHGHTWEVVAWFAGGGNAVDRSRQLGEVLSALDHAELPWKLSWGEEIAKHVARMIGWPCCRVDVNRPGERIFASYERDEPISRRPWRQAETMRAVVLRGLGFTYAQIAHDLGNRTAKAVKRRLQTFVS